MRLKAEPEIAHFIRARVFIYPLLEMALRHFLGGLGELRDRPADRAGNDDQRAKKRRQPDPADGEQFELQAPGFGKHFSFGINDGQREFAALDRLEGHPGHPALQRLRRPQKAPFARHHPPAEVRVRFLDHPFHDFGLIRVGEETPLLRNDEGIPTAANFEARGFRDELGHGNIDGGDAPEGIVRQVERNGVGRHDRVSSAFIEVRFGPDRLILSLRPVVPFPFEIIVIRIAELHEFRLPILSIVVGRIVVLAWGERSRLKGKAASINLRVAFDHVAKKGLECFFRAESMRFENQPEIFGNLCRAGERAIELGRIISGETARELLRAVDHALDAAIRSHPDHPGKEERRGPADPDDQPPG